MAEARVNGVRTIYSIDGPADGSTMMLSHPLASDRSIWEPQVAAFRSRYRVLTYDIRGHGGSEAPCGPWSLDDLVEDAVALLDRLGIDKVHFVGLSLGGMVGQLFALRYPERLLSLVLCDTASEMRSSAWAERVATALRDGMEPLVEPTLERWFTAGFRAAHPDIVGRIRGVILRTPREGYAACAAAIQNTCLTSRLREIGVPTLIVVGARDPSTPTSSAEVLHRRIRGSELSVIEGAAHVPNIEKAAQFSRIVGDFVARCHAQRRGVQ